MMKLTEENADYEDCRPVVHRRHSPEVDAFEKRMVEQVEAARASRSIKDTTEASENPFNGAEN
jgi:hypothetical protein